MTLVELTHDEYEKTRATIRADSEFSTSYMIMNMLAAVIASYGLFADSPAVVIGAMIVAMLLGPITGIGLSLVDADMSLLARAVPTLIAGGLGVTGVAAILGLVHREMPITNEIMVRTAPNLVDLMIALAGGAAGAFATVSPRLSVAFVGVAIATALVPPLCAATILLVRGEYDLAAGAYLLTFTNIVGIQFANSVVLWLAGFRKATGVEGSPFGGFVHSNLVTLVLVSALGIQLTINLRNTIAQEQFKSAVQSKLDGFFDSSRGAHLAGVRFERSSSGRKLIVRAVMRGPAAPSAEQVAAMEDALPRPPSGSLELRIRFVETQIINRRGPVLDDKEFALQL